MTQPAPANPRRYQAVCLAAAAIALSVFAAANAHLVYVAVVSEPGCIAHLKEKSVTPGGYRAAKSAC